MQHSHSGAETHHEWLLHDTAVGHAKKASNTGTQCEVILCVRKTRNGWSQDRPLKYLQGWGLCPPGQPVPTFNTHSESIIPSIQSELPLVQLLRQFLHLRPTPSLLRPPPAGSRTEQSGAPPARSSPA